MHGNLRLVLGVFVTCWVLPALIYATEPQPNYRISQFLTGNEKFNLLGARVAGFQGKLDLTGYDIHLDPATGEPLFRPQSSSSSTNPADLNWADIGSAFSGVDRPVHCMAMFQGKLIVGGEFRVAGKAKASNVAAWDGASWSPLGTGTNNTVISMTVWGDQLIVGGLFTEAGGAPALRIASWNGSSWAQFGSGAVSPPTAMTVYHDRVTIALEPASVYKWENDAWVPMRSLVIHTSIGRINTMAEYNGQLYIGGDFPVYDNAWTKIGANVAIVNDTSVVPINPAPNEVVRALATYNDQLFIGGDFTAVETDSVPGFAAWNGTAWSNFGGGIDHPDPQIPSVSALAVHDGKLMVGGTFSLPGEAAVSNIAAWGGTSWHDLPGAAVSRPACLLSGTVLYVGGSAQMDNDQGIANGVAARNGSRWSSLELSTDGHVVAVTVYQNKLIVGGYFNTICGVPARHIAAWDGATWSALGPGIGAGVVAELEVYDGKLIAVGLFSEAGGTPVNNIAAWDGVSWAPLGEGLNDGAGTLGAHGGKLYVAGRFTIAGGVPVRYIAAWDGSTWSSLGSGIRSNGGGVISLLEYGGLLYVGGHFQYAGDVPVTNLATWNGFQWAAVDPGPSTTGIEAEPLAMCIWDGKLVIGGTYSDGRNDEGVCLKTFDGAGWTNIDSTIPPICAVYSLLPYDDQLLVGGMYSVSPNLEVLSPGIIDYDPIAKSWTSLGSGIDGIIWDMAEYDSTVWFGGWFSTAGGRVSAHVAQWTGRDCGEGTTGDVNLFGIVDLADLSLLVAYLTVPLPSKPELPCVPEANINAIGIVDLADLSILVAYLTVPAPSKPVLPNCP